MPWAVRARGAGADAVLLSWLYHVTRADPATHPRAAAFRTYRDGQRCVAASQADIGFVLRLTGKQVKTAVARLRAEGFISTVRGRNKFGVKTMFTLDEYRCRSARMDDDEALVFEEDWPMELEPFRTM